MKISKPPTIVGHLAGLHIVPSLHKDYEFKQIENSIFLLPKMYFMVCQ